MKPNLVCLYQPETQSQPKWGDCAEWYVSRAAKSNPTSDFRSTVALPPTRRPRVGHPILILQPAIAARETLGRLIFDSSTMLARDTATEFFSVVSQQDDFPDDKRGAPPRGQHFRIRCGGPGGRKGLHRHRESTATSTIDPRHNVSIGWV